jgi:hypothetical protein
MHAGTKPHRRLRCVVDGGVEEDTDGGVEHGGRRGRFLWTFGQNEDGVEVVIVGGAAGGEEEVLIGVAEDAQLVEDGGVLVVGAELLRVLESTGGTHSTGGRFDVTAAVK